MGEESLPHQPQIGRTGRRLSSINPMAPAARSSVECAKENTKVLGQSGCPGVRAPHLGDMRTA